MREIVRSVTVAAAALALQSAAAQAASPVIYNFTYLNPVTSVFYPVRGLIEDSAGVLYGVTNGNAGTVYALTPPAPGQHLGTATVLHGFTGMPDDGSDPGGTLLRGPTGVLFGTTYYGGKSDLGTVYALSPPARPGGAWSERLLHSFITAEGEYPVGGLVMDAAGALYGATLEGGGQGGCQILAGCGTIFKLTPPEAGGTNWMETAVYRFTSSKDGHDPNGDLALDSAGNLYGTSYGGPVGAGEIYELSPPAAGQTAWTKTMLFGFPTLASGVSPNGGLLLDQAGALYGTTQYGGTGIGTKPTCSSTEGCGLVFKLSPPPVGQTVWTQTAIYDFPGAMLNGIAPSTGLAMDAAGNLYGTTIYGGACPGPYGNGTVYKLAPPSSGTGEWTETVPTVSTCTFGASPNGPLLLGADGFLYGTAAFGGTANYGTAFRIRY